MVPRILTVLTACVVLTACASHRQLGGAPGLTVIPGTELPVPQRADLAAIDRAYYLGPRDRLTIDVLGAPDLAQKEIVVDSGGRVSFPLAGSIEATGKTPEELAETIAERLRGTYFKDPRVTVNVLQMSSQIVTVEGEVKEPGIYPVINRMTLMGAVASAKGTTEYAGLEDVVIFRTVGDRRYAALYNLKAIRDGQYDDPAVYPNDVVMVGESSGRRLFQNILAILPVLTTPIILWLQDSGSN